MENLDLLKDGIGIMGGTFDPIHLAHTEIARAVKRKFNLSRVVIVPAFQNPLREHEQILAGTKERLIMAFLATMDDDWLFVDPLEIDRGRHRPGPSYTIDTLNSYQMRYPSIPLTLIVGADNIALHRWKGIEEYPDLLHRIVAVSRPEYEVKFNEDMKELRRLYPEVADLVTFVGDIHLPTSSTAVRESLRKGKVPTEVLDPRVSKFIMKYGLYGCREGCGI